MIFVLSLKKLCENACKHISKKKCAHLVSSVLVVGNIISHKRGPDGEVMSSEGGKVEMKKLHGLNEQLEDAMSMAKCAM